MEYGLRGDPPRKGSQGSLVLILVLMEYGLREKRKCTSRAKERDVLILVLMEYGLRAIRMVSVISAQPRLNPCFNGIWSASHSRSLHLSGSARQS